MMCAFDATAVMDAYLVLAIAVATGWTTSHCDGVDEVVVGVEEKEGRQR